MSNRLVSDCELDRALAFLRDSAHDFGEAKARAVRAEHMLRHIEALEFKMSDGKSAEARKADARTTDRYMEAIAEDAIACGEYEKLRALREAAGMRIETWRSEQANFRAMKI